MLVGVFVLGIVERRAAERVGDRRCSSSRCVLGALLAAGSLDDVSATWWPGLIVGAAAAALGWAAARSLFGRVRARLDTDAASALPLYAEGVALLAAGLSILFPPLAV